MLNDLIPLLAERPLTTEEIGAAMAGLFAKSASDETKAAFLSAWAKREETAEELAASAEALLPQAVDPGLRGAWNGKPLLDCCGTGGGGLNLFNVSTGVMFILAAMGVPVVKHGNRGVTKKSGSADVLEALGIKIDLPPARNVACLEEVGAVFLFAPHYHPTFATIAPVRKALAAQGQRTIFNLLGPLLNPARPDARLVGVFKPEHVELYQHALEKMNCPRYTVAMGKDRFGKPLGEVSPCGLTRVGTNVLRGHKTDRDEWQLVTQLQYNFSKLKPDNTHLEPHTEQFENLLVTGAEESAQRLLRIFQGEDKGLGRQLLVVNAAVAARTHGSVEDVLATTQAEEAIDSGRALECLKRYQVFSHAP